MTNGEAINWIINISADIGKAEHHDLWHYEQALSEIREMLETAQPDQKWIPCSERLPEDGQNVLVTYKTTGKIHLCQYHDDGSCIPWYSYIDQCRAYMNMVLAWMPLPEPYREEGEK